MLDIIQYDEKRAIKISKFLIEKKYAIETHIDTNIIFNSAVEVKTVRLFFITKALLFDMIDKEISERFYSKDLKIYATPVTHISQSFGDLLRNNLKAV